MQTQDIFKAFGPNWTWASITNIGTARVHTVEPTFSTDGVVCYSRKEDTFANVQAFDIRGGDGGARIIARTDFSNGPQYPTDRFGIPYPAPVAELPVMPMVPPPPLPECGYFVGGSNNVPPQVGASAGLLPAKTILTVEEAETGGLWPFARAPENYVSVNTFGVVWFNVHKDGPEPRRSYSVEVGGVTHPIERTRSPAVMPPEAGKPFTPAESVSVANSERMCNVFDCVELALPGDLCCKGHATHHSKLAVPSFDYQPARPGLRDDALKGEAVAPDDVHGWSDGVAELEKKLNRQRRVLKKAKARAHALLSIYNADGSTQLTCVQYTAIFGELPK